MTPKEYANACMTMNSWKVHCIYYINGIIIIIIVVVIFADKHR